MYSICLLTHIYTLICTPGRIFTNNPNKVMQQHISNNRLSSLANRQCTPTYSTMLLAGQIRLSIYHIFRAVQLTPFVVSPCGNQQTMKILANTNSCLSISCSKNRNSQSYIKNIQLFSPTSSHSYSRIWIQWTQQKMKRTICTARLESNALAYTSLRWCYPMLQRQL